MSHTINISPSPALVQTALDHCEIPLVVQDDHTVNVSELTGKTLTALLSAVVNLAMVKHIEDTMILPSNASRIREVVNDLEAMRDHVSGAENAEWIDELRETLAGVADNLEGAYRS